jgi:hypothetical protein
VHESYQGLARWPGSETSDIVYEDHRGILTQLLIEKGYLTNSIWAGRSPTFYIEVKTTVSLLGTQFYCSQNQYDLMENMKLCEDRSSSDIYLIARVYSLGDSRMGLKLYLDPANLRRERQLVFRAEKYFVTPL